jgi:serine O-acetyltransferase
MLNHHHNISSDEPDWSRENKSFLEWAPSKSLLAAIRRYQSAEQSFFLTRWIIKKVAVLQHRFWSIVTGAEIPINCQIGGGLLIPHPNGIVIHPSVSIGPNCLILQQVTLGMLDGDIAPMVGGHVDIGAGAKILGGIRIGNHVKIGANAVVLINVPENMTAVGIPAKLLM